MAKNTQIILVALIIAVLGVLAFSYGGTDQAKQTATTTNAFEQTYTTQDGTVTFSYPQRATVTEENNVAKIQILGPGNEPQTEISNGLTGYISLRELGNRPLGLWAELLFAKAKKEGAAGLQKVQEDTFADRSGYSFQVETRLNSTSTHYLLEGDQRHFLHVSYDAVGPDAKRFTRTFADIVRTVTLQAGTSTQDSTRQDKATTTQSDKQSLAQACESAGGSWLSQYSECESIQASWCEKHEGNFDSCASACRHDPDAQACTQQCVQVCDFTSSGE